MNEFKLHLTAKNVTTYYNPKQLQYQTTCNKKANKIKRIGFLQSTPESSAYNFEFGPRVHKKWYTAALSPKRLCTSGVELNCKFL